MMSCRPALRARVDAELQRTPEVTYREVARRLGVSHGSVSTIAREAGALHRPPGRRPLFADPQTVSSLISRSTADELEARARVRGISRATLIREILESAVA